MEALAHSVLQRELDGPPIDPQWLKGSHQLRHREWRERDLCKRDGGARMLVSSFDMFIPPPLRRALVEEDGLAFIEAAPIPPPDRQQGGTQYIE